MTIEETYNNWRAKLQKPNDSIFYYHPNLERIILGFAIFELSSKPLLQKLGKAESLGLLHLYIPDLITAWIDETEEYFATMFRMVMSISEGYMLVGKAMAAKYPSRQKAIMRISMFFGNAIAIAGDMAEEKANDLLDDLTTDSRQIYSDKIKEFGEKLLSLTKSYGMDIPMSKLMQLLR